MSGTWIFQGIPDDFDIDGYLAAGLDRITWRVVYAKYANEMTPGDPVFIWRAAGKVKAVSGVIATATIDSEPWTGFDHAEAKPFRTGPPVPDVQDRYVWLRLDRVAKTREVIKRAWLKDDPVCAGLQVIKQPTGTNYPVPEHHAVRLRALWERTGMDWSWDESVAAMLVYEELGDQPISKRAGSPVANLALMTGRAIGAAYNKVLNFRALDPRDERTGLTGAGSTDTQVWAEFYEKATEQVRLGELRAEYERLWKDVQPTGVEAGTEDPLGGDFGQVYVEADEAISPAPKQPAKHDPDVVKAGWQAHARTQNLLAKAVAAAGCDARSPVFRGPQYDLAWTRDGLMFVVEVKSITATNEERQLRMGLGQVLRYRHLLGGGDVRPVLVASQRPNDVTWEATCKTLGVVLAWPDTFDRLFGPC